MTKDRAIKAVDRLEAVGIQELLGEYYSREMYIRKFETLNEENLKPDFIELLNMGDFKFKLMVPVLKPIIKAAVNANMRTIEKNLNKMMAN